MGLDIDLVQQSFQSLAPQADRLTERFYERLFARHPAVQPLFAGVDLREQRRKLLAALVLVVNNLRNPDALAETLRALGWRHVAYGAESAHYDAVGETLVATLAELAGDGWSEKHERAWVAAYGEVARLMREGAAQSPRAAHAAG